MFKKFRYLIPVLGLMILFSLCSCTYAQEIQSQSEDENEDQTSVLLNNNVNANQTTNLMGDGETKNFTFTDEMIKELFAPQEPDEGLEYKENAKDLRIAVDVIVKADNQVKLKYSECDIKTLNINLGFLIHGGNLKDYPMYEDHDGAHVLISSVKNAEFCKFTYTLTRDGDLPTEPSLGYVNKNLTTFYVITKLYGYNSWERCPLEKRYHHHDRDRECCGSNQDESYDLGAE